MKILDENKPVNIIEITKVIQGEGKSTGVPMILIRTKGCNLRCQFKNSICDAWLTSWEQDKKSDKFTLNDIREFLKRENLVHRVMLTGGEPTMSKTLFENILKVCHEEGKTVEIETNGTNFIDEYQDIISLVSISPKLKNSIPRVKNYIGEIDRVIEQKEVDLHLKNQQLTIESTKQWVNKYITQLKFVVSQEEDLVEILNFVDQVGADLRNVWLMPEGLSREQISQKQQWVYEKCLELGMNYSGRLHIAIYDTKQNV
jgi:7-carboxy-7-deazaguanine synthase